MSRRGENIYKRRDGRWEARYIKGYELSGKIKYGYCYGKSYREVKEKLNSARTGQAAQRPLSGASCQQKFDAYCERWLISRRDVVRESTYVKYHTILEKHIRPQLGSLIPQALDAQCIDVFRNQLLCEKCLSPKTVRDILIVLGAILKSAENQFPEIFPKVEIIYPREQKKEMRVLSLEEQSRFTAYLREDMDDCKFGVLLAVVTGLRIGELCALKWGNVNVQSRRILVDATMQRLADLSGGACAKSKIVIGPPKSEMSSRVIPMSDSIVDLCRTFGAGLPETYVLTGTPLFMEPRALQYRMDKYTRECGLEDVHFHTLRHTFATRCAEVGFEIKSLSEVLGHSNTAVTLNRYIHSSFALKQENMNKLATVGL